MHHRVWANWQGVLRKNLGQPFVSGRHVRAYGAGGHKTVGHLGAHGALGQVVPVKVAEQFVVIRLVHEHGWGYGSALQQVCLKGLLTLDLEFGLGECVIKEVLHGRFEHHLGLWPKETLHKQLLNK